MKSCVIKTLKYSYVVSFVVNDEIKDKFLMISHTRLASLSIQLVPTFTYYKIREGTWLFILEKPRKLCTHFIIIRFIFF